MARLRAFLCLSLPLLSVQNNYIIRLKNPIDIDDLLLDSIYHRFEASFAGFAAALNHTTKIYLLQHPDVAYIVPDDTVYTSCTLTNTHEDSTEPLKRQLSPPSWGLVRISQRHRDPQQNYYEYPSKAGENVTVFVVDSGVDDKHPDLQGRVTQGRNFITDEPMQDLAGHGTHVAGTIAGTRFGVAKKARIHAIKALDKSGEGNSSQLIAALSHLLTLKSPGLKIVNLSLHTSRNKAVDEIVEKLGHNGFLLITSTANTGKDTCDISPGGSSVVLSVGAVDSSDNLWENSGTGPCVSLLAPGVDILSAWPGGSKIMSGTSMAAPHVAGVAALFLSTRIYPDPAALKTALIEAATPGVAGDVPRDTTNLLVYNQPQ